MSPGVIYAVLAICCLALAGVALLLFRLLIRARAKAGYCEVFLAQHSSEVFVIQRTPHGRRLKKVVP